MPNMIFSFQGSFGPPTFGHFMSMFTFAEQIQKDYRDVKKTLLFMPAAGGSKQHLFPTRDSRFNVLRVFCRILTSYFPDITFDVSDIEYNIAGTDNKSVATIHTIKKLCESKVSETDEICLGMGLDNAYQLPYWESVAEYAQYVRKIYVVHRDPTPVEKQNIRLFDVTNADGTCAKLYFDTRVPSWCKKPLSLTSSYTLPTIVAIRGDPIPPTSSSMLRHFIRRGDREKVKTIMFGLFIDDPADAVEETMRSFWSDESADHSFDEEYDNLLRLL